MKELIAVTLMVILLAALIGLGPLATIWSLNTVFNLGIAYNFWTWLGTLWLGMCIFPNKAIKKNS